MKNHKTAILLFTRSAVEEAACKVFEPSINRKGNTRIADVLIKDARSMANRSHNHVYIIDSNEQIGATFGERLANAFVRLYQKGFENVIAIGNDCPQLDSRLLQEAVQSFKQHEVVLGPAEDGGAYLIGMNHGYFVKKEFIALPWKTNRLFDELAHQLHIRGAGIKVLGMLGDIDSSADLRKLLAVNSGREGTHALVKTLRSIIAGFNTAHSDTAYVLPDQFLSSSILLRAPPSSIAA